MYWSLLSVKTYRLFLASIFASRILAPHDALPTLMRFFLRELCVDDVTFSLGVGVAAAESNEKPNVKRRQSNIETKTRKN